MLSPRVTEKNAEYDEMLDALQGETFQYFVEEVNPENGLVQDRTAEGAPASITASAGPGEQICEVDGRERQFYGYLARGVPEGPDDGTLSPWAVVASLPFAPDVVLATIRHYDEAYPEMRHAYGYRCSFNPTFPSEESGHVGWISDGYYGLNQGPIILMIENYRTGLVWELMKQCPYVVTGLSRAGFSGGWLSSMETEHEPSSSEGGEDET